MVTGPTSIVNPQRLEARPGPNTETLRVMVLSRCASTYGSSRGGADTLSQRHAQLLADQGFRVDYVGVAPIDRPDIQTVVVRIRNLLREGPEGSHLRSLVLLNEGIHVIHAALCGAVTRRRNRVRLVVSNSSIATILLKVVSPWRPVVHYVHDGLTPDPAPDSGRSDRRNFMSSALNNVLERIALRVADRVICASDSIATEAALIGVKTSKLSIMYPLLQQGVREQPHGIPRNLGPVHPNPYLLSVGQQTGRKRFDLLIRALRGIPEPYRLVLVGDGPFHQQYRTLAQEVGVASRVLFLTNVDDSTLRSLYRLCALFVLASENEGFPITVAEALSEGAPVVLAGPSTYALRRRLPPVFLTTVYDLDATTIARTVTRRLREVESEGPQLHHRIRAWAIQLFPSEEQIVKEYSRIFDSLSSRIGLIVGSSPPWVLPE